MTARLAVSYAIARNVSFERIDSIIDNATRSFTQADGATAYIKKTSRNNYDVVVESDDGIITVIVDKTRGELRDLANNYGWEGFDW